jgi:hypothetical protein
MSVIARPWPEAQIWIAAVRLADRCLLQGAVIGIPQARLSLHQDLYLLLFRISPAFALPPAGKIAGEAGESCGDRGVAKGSASDCQLFPVTPNRQIRFAQVNNG